jgi:hypothetical protein
MLDGNAVTRREAANRRDRRGMARDQVEETELRRIISDVRTRREYGRLPTGAQGPHSPTD